MMKVNYLTVHAEEDRMERIAFIATTAEFGEVRFTKTVQEQGRVTRLELTSTGVLIVTNPEKKALVTMFLATIDQAIWVSEGQLSQEVRQAVKRNSKRGWIKQQDRVRA